ncbi:carotenoid oxygenase [Aspergillus sclerotiicarbonarius CBS 121057]|uniref:Carotenoid oxygenase n=1 Tax=Aspergillus sclerotiicarbonarius (strain CBS 121057 / IBT 28362) TaxID=1448318 RepID=A0A319EBM4_ASPSB|nr:carotenoid oxygenase [Aspergillus sclerotiicarbonarius CBS 121057]
MATEIIPIESKTWGPDGHYGLRSKWPVALDLAGSNLPCRLEGEVGSLVVFGDIPKEITGVFYRVMVDPYVPPDERNVPIDGDGSISAFWFHDGKVDMKMRYIETERYKLERKAGRALFGLYRNPFTHHPCVRAAVDSTANTNLVYWAGYLLALKEVALPYAVDPITLDTIKYDPFAGQVRAKTFTAHPKVDPRTNELVVFGYEATGLGSLDVVIYALDQDGVKTNEFWFRSPWCAFIHDCAITPNFVVLFLWPFEASVERMKQGKQHWAWNYDRPATFIVVPRRPGCAAEYGWKEKEHQVYEWKNCMPIHTAGAWESGDGMLYVESTRVHDNAFPFFPTESGEMPSSETKGDFVRWAFDLRQPTGTVIDDPEVLLDVPCEFPRIDERFLGVRYEWVFLNVFIPQRSDDSRNIFQGLNGLAMHNNNSGETRFFYAGDDSLCQEPIFIPRSAEEGDGWVMTLIERKASNRCEIAVIDTEDFERPVAIVQLPFHVKAQIHGNWVPAARLALEDIVKQDEVLVSGRGALEPL